MKLFCTLSFILIIYCSSCKTSQAGSSPKTIDEIKVTDNGYINDYVPGSEKKAWADKTEAEKKWAVLQSLIGSSPEISIKPTLFIYPSHANKEIGLSYFPEEKIIVYAYALKKYAIQNGYDTSYGLLANMGQLSSTKRLYLVNLSTYEIVSKALVSHGRGKEKSIYTRQYSNLAGSNCTSLGKYKLGSFYKGRYGDSYRMEGLESSNSNAAKRSIVLHAMSCIPDTESYAPACVTEGCPAVSESYFSSVQSVIDNRSSPMLFWIFDSLLQEPVVEKPAAVNNTVAGNNP